MPIVAFTNITTIAQLNNAIEAADNELGNGYTFGISLANYATIDLTTALEAINVGPSTVVDIEGNGGTLDGASPTGASYDQRGLFVYSGTVNVQLLTIANTKAIGGNATGGGGGAGLGGGLFVANDTTGGPLPQQPADVTLIGTAGVSAFTLCTVLTPTPRAFATFSIPSPAVRRARIAASFLLPTFGRPSCLPSARTRASPAMTRSRIMPRSSSAKTAAIRSIARPCGVADAYRRHGGRRPAIHDCLCGTTKVMDADLRRHDGENAVVCGQSIRFFPDGP